MDRRAFIKGTAAAAVLPLVPVKLEATPTQDLVCIEKLSIPEWQSKLIQAHMNGYRVILQLGRRHGKTRMAHELWKHQHGYA